MSELTISRAAHMYLSIDQMSMEFVGFAQKISYADYCKLSAELSVLA